MDDSEKRGRGIFARRQQQPSTTPVAPLAPPSSPQRKSRRKMSDIMLGVAAGLAARKNNTVVQTPSSAGLPRHFDFSYRDRTDVTAKRRFQVKVPFRLMVILSLIFLLIPGMIFVHKELHIHEDQYISHYKAENYVNVNTKDVWDNFKQATTTDDTMHQKVEVNTTVVKQKSTVHKSYSGDVASSLHHNHTVSKPIVSKNETNPIPATTEDEPSGDADNEDEEESLPEEVAHSESVDEGDQKELSSGDTILEEGIDNKIINDEDAKNVGTKANTTASENIPDRRRRKNEMMGLPG
mmetsp:Transcript_17632/g.43999  ORF Transcript_17632/g.43999 Transcript_17632/m.43999 type:complete len:295 (+) Transcript_17632:143-1027(+)